MTCVVLPLGPACVNITGIRGGDQNLITATITMAGVPLNLTGMTITAQARKKAEYPDPPALEAVIDVVDAATGSITMRWPGADVTTLLGGKGKWTGVWDMQITNGVDDPTTIVAGTFEAVMDVTR